MIKGIALRGKGRVIEIINNKKIVLQMQRILPVREVITFQGFEDKTTLSLDVGYERPGKIISFLFRLSLDLLNMRQLNIILNNIRTVLEKGNIETERAVK